MDDSIADLRRLVITTEDAVGGFDEGFDALTSDGKFSRLCSNLTLSE